MRILDQPERLGHGLRFRLVENVICYCSVGVSQAQKLVGKEAKRIPKGDDDSSRHDLAA